jgi:hypothetical protein
MYLVGCTVLYLVGVGVPCRQCCGSGPGSRSVSIRITFNKLTGRENLAKKILCVGSVGPTDKENQVKMYKKQCSGSETFWNGSGSGSLVWYQDFVDPDPDLDPSLFSACLNRNYQIVNQLNVYLLNIII